MRLHLEENRIYIEATSRPYYDGADDRDKVYLAALLGLSLHRAETEPVNHVTPVRDSFGNLIGVEIRRYQP